MKIIALISCVALVLLCEVSARDFPGATARPQKAPFQPNYYEQKLDHFSDNNATWQQLYYVNDTSMKEGGPIFIFIGGEANLDFFITTLPQIGMTELLAVENEGAFVALEHRYYGNNPYGSGNLTLDNLKYLSVEQALEDLSTFAAFISDKLGSKKVVVTGVSYSGALAAYARLKYPDQYLAAYASSGVVQARLDFIEYSQQSADDAGKYCAESMMDAVQEIDMILQEPDGAAALGKIFNTCDDISEDPTDFLYEIGGAVIGPAQEADENSVCSYFNETGSTLVNYVNLMYSGEPNATCLEVYHFEDAISEVPVKEVLGGRPWWYQKCTQFGFFKDAPSENSILSSKVNLDMHYGFCKRIFGTDMKPDVDGLNKKFEGDNTTATKVVFVNGGEDPWHHCSILESRPEQDIYAYVTKGAGHGRETLPPAPSDSVYVKKARSFIQTYISEWLGA